MATAEAAGSWRDVQTAHAGGAAIPAEDEAELAQLHIPLDEHNATMLDCVHPHKWQDPEPAAGFEYDLLALGAGAGGLVSAKQTARRGGKSALVEMHMHGGDCLTVGCVPSKALIRAARAVREVRRAAKLGVVVGEVKIDFPFIMERMRKLRARIAPADAVGLSSSFGVDVFQGRGIFTGPHSLEVNGKTLTFKKAVVATGGSPSLPPIPGLKDVPYMTNKTLFNLTTLPPRMVVVGAGPIGSEMAQTFSLFGSDVTVLDLGTTVLFREDPEAAAIVGAAMAEDGCSFAFGIKNLRFSHTPAAGHDAFPKIVAHFDEAGAAEGAPPTSLECDALLIATGRVPNVEGVGLEAAGVKYERRTGVAVDDLMVTSNPDIYAVGDCSSKWQFTHMAGTQAQMVVDNAVFGQKRTVSSLVVPRCTYTSPEVAGTGMSEQELTAAGVEYDTFKSNLAHVDRAILESSDEGFCKVLVRKGTPEILGATIVAENAGDIISELTLAIQAGVGLDVIARTIHPYPTVAEAIAGCAFSYKTQHWQTRPKPAVAPEPEAKQ